MEGWASLLAKLVAKSALGEIKGIGEGCSNKKNHGLVEKGEIEKYYDELNEASIPPGC